MITVKQQVNQIRWTFSKRRDSYYKQVGLRRLRDALATKDPAYAEELLREAAALLATARAHDEREEARK